jgi:exonuclease SbcC
MRVMHIADLHLRESSYEEAKASIEAIEQEAAREHFDLIALAGDTWDGPIQNSDRAGFGRLLDLIRRLADIAPVAMIYGTPTHDTEGSLEVFERITAKYSITILRPGKAYFLGEDATIYEPPFDSGRYPRALLFGVPEPSKKWLLAGAGAIGKDESDQVIRTALRNLFLGLGGMRKEHPDLPCVLLYHGQVGGAQTAKEFVIEAGTGISASRDDFAAVGADYIALGDIHMPQQIGDLPAYYPGPLYPTSWGETGFEFGANVVEIDYEDSNPVHVSRLPFPHPVQTKLLTTAADPVPDTASGRVWIEVLPETQEQERMLDADELLARLLGHGALPGSRVTIRRVATETVRAAEIMEKKRHRDKVQVWADNSSLPVSEEIRAKADALELEAAAAGGAPSGSAFRITRLILRGAKGIWKKSRKDEIDLDLEALGEGVIAFASPNGAGKTTILENLHVWPSLLTRKGTLQTHFRLRDSFRELYLTDEATGDKYRARILINAAVASGKTEYWLDRDTGTGFEPMPGITGRLDDYETVIAALFGSLPLFLKSAFLTQRSSPQSPDLAEATKGERKALFAELSGIGYFDLYRASAKAKADALETEIRILDATIAAADGVEESIADLVLEIEAQGKAETDARHVLVKSEERGNVLKAEKEVLELRVAEVNRKAEKTKQLETEIADLMKAIEEDRNTEALFSTAAEGRGAAEKDLADLKDLETKVQKLREEKAVVDQENLKAAKAYREAVAIYEAARKRAQESVNLAKDTKAKAERDLASAQARLSAPIVDHCPTCNQLLPEETRTALQEGRKKNEDEVQAIEARIKTLGDSVTTADTLLAALKAPESAEPKPFPGTAELAEVEADKAMIDAAAAQEILRKAGEAEIRIEEARKRIKDKESRINAATMELKESKPTMADVESLPLLESKKVELEAERNVYADARDAIARAQTSAEAAKKAKEEAERRAEKKIVAQVSRAAKAADLNEWRFLERADGPDGIPALELDAIAPSISAVANRILSEAYGSRYEIEFRTTRIAGAGSKKKQVEDFEIFIKDSEDGDEQEIATLSGGEGVWIKKAIYDAFSVIRARNTGIKFQTVFLDEADGALDPDMRMKYLRMLEAAHREAGRFQTILVTHSIELQAMVSQIINVADLGPRKEAQGVAA